MDRIRGFTLVELLLTVALIVTLVTLGIPSLQSTSHNSRLITVVNDFIGALNLTRSEAIKRGVRVTLCKSNNGMACANSGGYEQGWIVFIDLNNNAVVDANETIIRIFAALPGRTSMTLTGNRPVSEYVSFIATGMTQLVSGAFQAGTLTLCAPPKARRIVINSVGRVRTEEATC
ncbi:MAG: GspH/FimT family pseudopilin [Candidatus Competibacteraceae bacterium]|nr:GspH/FimT family pseudopilin [Candidatus Competibacteraceae bacterium]